MLAFLVAAISVSASFEGGSVGRVEHVAPDYLKCAVKGQADQNNRNRQANWYYFRLDGLPQREVRMDLTDLVGKYNFRPGSHSVTRNSRPVYSYDNRTWKHFTDEQSSWDEKAIVLTIRFRPERSTMWVAHMMPYTTRELNRLIKDVGGHPHLKRSVAGKTVHGREIPLLTITDNALPEAGKKVVWLMARQHAWETGTSLAADGAVRFLLSKEAEAEKLRRATIFQVLPVFDMDGMIEGAVRFNVNGYDNNRNWDTVDPKLMPEIAGTRKTMLDWLDAGHRIDLFLAMHDTESVDYVSGPITKGGPAMKAVADDLVSRLRATTSFYDPKSPRDSMGQAVGKGRMTVYQGLFTERKVPAFGMELMVERHPQLGRPRTEEDFREFGAGLAKCLAAAAGSR